MSEKFPSWLQELAEHVVIYVDSTLPVGWSAYMEDAEAWMLDVYPMPAQCGECGDHDLFDKHFFVDITGMMSEFDVSEYELDIAAGNWGISIGGQFSGHDVTVCVLSEPPADVDAEVSFNLADGSLGPLQPEQEEQKPPAN